MKKSRDRLQKMQNFQQQDRRVIKIEPISENHKHAPELVVKPRTNDQRPKQF